MMPSDLTAPLATQYAALNQVFGRVRAVEHRGDPST